MIVEKFRRLHPPISHPDREEIPVLVVQMPSEPSVIRFYVAVLAALGAPLRPRQRLAELEQVALALLRATGVRMLVVDELHNVLAGRGDVRREFLNLIRFLGNELRIPLVGVGTRQAYLAIRSDDQLENRFEPFPLPLWQPGAEACSLLASFAASFPLRRPSPIATEEMARYLLTRSEGTIGELTRLLTDASIAAIDSGEEAINQRTLLLAPTSGPPNGAGYSSENWCDTALATAPGTDTGRGTVLVAAPTRSRLRHAGRRTAAAQPRHRLTRRRS